MLYFSKKSRTLLVAAFVAALSVSVARADDGFNPRLYDGVFQQSGDIAGLVGRTDADLNLYVISVAPGAQGQSSNIGGLIGRTDANLNLYVTLASGSVIAAPSFTGQALFADGTALLPSIAFASEPTLGFYRSGAEVVTVTGGLATTVGSSLNSSGDVIASATRFIQWNSRAAMASSANGNISLSNSAGTIGSQLKVDALPTIASGFGTGAAVTAGSTPLAGSIDIGTGGTAFNGTINFNGTAFPSVPFCIATNRNTTTTVRPTTVTTTQMILTNGASNAWNASDIVTWHCISSK